MWPSSNVYTTCVCIIRVSTAYPIVVSTIMLFGYRVLRVPFLDLKQLYSILTHAHNSSNRNRHVGISTVLYKCVQMYTWPCTCIHIRMQQLERTSTSLARLARFLKRFTRWPTQIDTYTRTFITVRATQSSAQHAVMWIQHATHLHSQYCVKPIVLSLTYTYLSYQCTYLCAYQHSSVWNLAQA